MTIPPIIHQIWYQGIDNIKEPYKKCFVNTIKIIKISKWNHIFWDKEKIDSFIKLYYPHYYDLYNYFDIMIQKLDIARYLILYHYGGCYLDMDIELLKDFSDLIEVDDEIIVSNIKTSYKIIEIDNGVLFSNIKNKFWIDLLDHINICKDNKIIKMEKTIYVNLTTGPYNFTKFIKKNKNNYKIKRLNYIYFNSRESKYEASSKLKYNKNIYAINYFNNSWMPPFSNFIILLYSQRLKLLILIILILIVAFYKKNINK